MNEFIQSDNFIIDLNLDFRGIHASPASQYANETRIIQISAENVQLADVLFTQFHYWLGLLKTPASDNR